MTARHGERTVLDGIDLVIPGGTTLAVVGRSGAGKSLLAAVAGRLTDPDAGEVLLDGVPLHALRHDALRTAIGYAFDRPALLGTTIEDTIAFGLRPPSPPESEKRHAWPTRTPSSAVSRTATPPPSPTRDPLRRRVPTPRPGKGVRPRYPRPDPRRRPLQPRHDHRTPHHQLPHRPGHHRHPTPHRPPRHHGGPRGPGGVAGRRAGAGGGDACGVVGIGGIPGVFGEAEGVGVLRDRAAQRGQCPERVHRAGQPDAERGRAAHRDPRPQRRPLPSRRRPHHPPALTTRAPSPPRPPLPPRPPPRAHPSRPLVRAGDRADVPRRIRARPCAGRRVSRRAECRRARVARDGRDRGGRRGVRYRPGLSRCRRSRRTAEGPARGAGRRARGAGGERRGVVRADATGGAGPGHLRRAGDGVPVVPVHRRGARSPGCARSTRCSCSSSHPRSSSGSPCSRRPCVPLPGGRRPSSSPTKPSPTASARSAPGCGTSRRPVPRNRSPPTPPASSTPNFVPPVPWPAGASCASRPWRSAASCRSCCSSPPPPGSSATASPRAAWSAPSPTSPSPSSRPSRTWSTAWAPAAPASRSSCAA